MDYYDEAEELRLRMEAIGNNYFKPRHQDGVHYNPVIDEHNEDIHGAGGMVY